VLALYIILNEVDFLEEVLAAFVKAGVKGATILESQGMGRAIVANKVNDTPLFGYLKTMLEGAHPYNKTIMAVVENEQIVQKVIEQLKLVKNQSKNKQSFGFVFTTPVAKVYPL
jgi:nitrogen regulatory protein P-II 1